VRSADWLARHCAHPFDRALLSIDILGSARASSLLPIVDVGIDKTALARAALTFGVDRVMLDAIDSTCA
jgi:hypothetical protein